MTFALKKSRNASFLLIVVLLFFACTYTGGVLAQERFYYTDSMICPQDVIPAGKVFRPIGIEADSVKLEVDTAFVSKMQRERGFTPREPTPIYDLSLKVLPTWGFCYVSDTSPYLTNYPAKLPFEAYIYAPNDAGGLGDKVVGPGVFNYLKENENGDPVYEWLLSGWINGITSSSKLETLIASVASHGYLTLIVVDQNGKNVLEKRIYLSLCAPISGSGTHHIVGMRDDLVWLSDMIGQFEKDRTQGFASIEPYKKYQNEFSYDIDLFGKIGSHKDIGLFLGEVYKAVQVDSKLHNGLISSITSSSKCMNGTHLMYSSSFSLGGGVALLHIGDDGSALIRIGSDPYLTVHEFSHTFAGLNDEYVYRNSSGAERFGFTFTNCSSDPKRDYVFDNKKFGGDNWQGCSLNKFYRPTFNSLMNGPDIDQSLKSFNVVSCGYILAAIKGGLAKDYWSECSNLGGTTLTGFDKARIMAVSIGENLRGFLSNIFRLGVVDAQITGPSFIIAENLDSDHSGGYILADYGTDSRTSPSPSGLSAIITEDGTVHLRWSGPSGQEQSFGYKIFRDGLELDSVTENEYIDSSVSEGETHIYFVLAYDSFGRESLPSSEVLIYIQENNVGSFPDNFGGFPMFFFGLIPEDYFIGDDGPSITNIMVNEGDVGVEITWKTDTPATSIVQFTPKYDYDIKGYFDKFVQFEEFVVYHGVHLSDLEPDTEYAFVVRSVGAFEKESVSEIMNFKTPIPPSLSQGTISSGRSFSLIASSDVAFGEKNTVVIRDANGTIVEILNDLVPDNDFLIIRPSEKLIKASQEGPLYVTVTNNLGQTVPHLIRLMYRSNSVTGEDENLSGRLIKGLVPCGFDKNGDGAVAGAGEECTGKDVFKLINNIINFLIVLGLLIVAITITYAGFLYIFAAGREAVVARAKELIRKVIFGYFVVLVAWVFVYALELAFYSDDKGAPNSFLTEQSGKGQ